MARITNPEYRKFLDTGEIVLVELDHLSAILDQCNGLRGKHVKEGRAFLIALYYTGARPVELLNLTGSSIRKDGNFITVSIPPAKNGLARRIDINIKRKHATELLHFAERTYPDAFLFFHYRARYVVRIPNRKGMVKEHIVIANRIPYHIKKWTSPVFPPEGITPYHFRHSRFSKLIEGGATMNELKLMKGAKSYSSIDPYIHMSKQLRRRIASRPASR